MLVRDVMRGEVFTVREDERLSQALTDMLSRGVRHAVVMRNARIVGVLSERNVFGHRARFARDGVVREAMTAEPYVTDPEASLAAASAVMATHKIGCLPVADGARLVGIITTTDLLTALAQEEVPPRLPSELAAKHVMRQPVELVSAETTLLDAAHRMLQRGVRHLPAVDGEDRLVGMLSDRHVRSVLGDLRQLMDRGAVLERLGAARVATVMARNPHTSAPDTPLDEVGRLLADERVDAVPVIDEQAKVIGIISYVDVLHALVGSAGRRPAG